jgi:hypothetical protein
VDKKVEKILNFLSNDVGSSYSILEKSEIVDALAPKVEVTAAELTSALNYLADKEYVSIKYQSESEVCLAVTSRTDSFLQYKNGDTERAVLTKKQHAMMFAIGVVGAFVGALLAVLLAKILGL